MRKLTVYVLSITLTSYFCLNTAQYIHVVEYSECFIMDARVLKFVRISGVCSYGHQTLQTACSYRGTTDGVVNNNNTTLFYFLLLN